MVKENAHGSLVKNQINVIPIYFDKYIQSSKKVNQNFS